MGISIRRTYLRPTTGNTTTLDRCEARMLSSLKFDPEYNTGLAPRLSSVSPYNSELPPRTAQSDTTQVLSSFMQYTHCLIRLSLHALIRTKRTRVPRFSKMRDQVCRHDRVIRSFTWEDHPHQANAAWPACLCKVLLESYTRSVSRAFFSGYRHRRKVSYQIKLTSVCWLSQVITSSL